MHLVDLMQPLEGHVQQGLVGRFELHATGLGGFRTTPEGRWRLEAALLRLIQLELCHPMHRDIGNTNPALEYSDLLPRYRELMEAVAAWQLYKFGDESYDEVYKEVASHRKHFPGQERAVGVVVGLMHLEGNRWLGECHPIYFRSDKRVVMDAQGNFDRPQSEIESYAKALINALEAEFKIRGAEYDRYW